MSLKFIYVGRGMRTHSLCVPADGTVIVTNIGKSYPAAGYPPSRNPPPGIKPLFAAPFLSAWVVCRGNFRYSFVEELTGKI